MLSSTAEEGALPAEPTLSWKARFQKVGHIVWSMFNGMMTFLSAVAQAYSRYVFGLHVFSNLALAVVMTCCIMASRLMDKLYGLLQSFQWGCDFSDWLAKKLRIKKAMHLCVATGFAILNGVFDVVIMIFCRRYLALPIPVAILFGLGRLIERVVYKVFLYGKRNRPPMPYVFFGIEICVGILEAVVSYASLLIIGHYGFLLTSIIVTAHFASAMHVAFTSYLVKGDDPSKEKSREAQEAATDAPIFRFIKKAIEKAPYVVMPFMVLAAIAFYIARHATGIASLTYFGIPLLIEIYTIFSTICRVAQMMVGLMNIYPWLKFWEKVKVEASTENSEEAERATVSARADTADGGLGAEQGVAASAVAGPTSGQPVVVANSTVAQTLVQKDTPLLNGAREEKADQTVLPFGERSRSPVFGGAASGDGPGLQSGDAAGGGCRSSLSSPLGPVDLKGVIDGGLRELGRLRRSSSLDTPLDGDGVKYMRPNAKSLSPPQGTGRKTFRGQPLSRASTHPCSSARARTSFK